MKKYSVRAANQGIKIESGLLNQSLFLIFCYITVHWIICNKHDEIRRKTESDERKT